MHLSGYIYGINSPKCCIVPHRLQFTVIYSIMVSPNCYITMRSPSSLGWDISPLHFVDHYHGLVPRCTPIEATSPSHELVPPEVIMIRCQRSLSFVLSSSSSDQSVTIFLIGSLWVLCYCEIFSLSLNKWSTIKIYSTHTVRFS